MSGGGGGDGPGAPLWIISFADMITNLVIFFIVVATYASRNTETNSVPRKILDRQVGVFGDPKDRQLAASVRRPGAVAQHGEVGPELRPRRREEEIAALMTKVQDARYNVAPRITELEDGVRLSLDEAVAFSAGSDRLRPEARELVAEIGRLYRGEPVEFIVEAHTDDRSFEYSRHGSALDLSRAMAVSVAGSLVRDAGLDAPRVGVSPCGDEQPLDTNKTATGRARNRRIEIVVRDTP